MKRLLCTLLVLSAIFLVVPATRAQAHPGDSTVLAAPAVLISPDTAVTVTREITGTNELTGSVRIATALATYFGLDVQQILDLHAAELGFGNIAIALFTSRDAKLSLEQILELRAQDMGWGEIRLSLGLFPGMAHQSLGQIVGRGNSKAPDWVPPGLAKRPVNITPPRPGPER